jgi:hypothetical protein
MGPVGIRSGGVNGRGTVDGPPEGPRGIGPVGTLARVSLGLFMVGSVVLGHIRGEFHPVPFVLGLVVFPAVVLGWQGRRARRNPERLDATGPVEHILTVVVFLALYFTWWYAPSVSALSDAALLFFGISMLAAAARGYRGCEVLAISNWVLGRDDQVGCLLFEPCDRVERRWRRHGSHRASEPMCGRPFEDLSG